MSIFIHHGASTLEIRACSDALKESSESEIWEAQKTLRLGNESHQVLNAMDVETAFNKTLAFYQWIEAAGGILRDRSGRILLIFRRGHWDLPKGKIDPGEAPLEAAFREVAEETGMHGLIKESDLPPSFHIYLQGGEWVLKKTHWFLFAADSEEELSLQTEEDILDAKWMHPSEIKEIWHKLYPSLQPLLHSIIP